MLPTSPFKLPRKTPFGLAEHFAEWATGLSKLDEFYAQRPALCTTEQFLRFTLDVLGIDYQVRKGALSHLPETGATVVVANHPLGCVEGIILAELLLARRSDVKILANHYLKTVPELDALFIGVDVFTEGATNNTNVIALRQAHKHLAQGGVLLIFPAGEVSHWVDHKQKRLEDREWSHSVSRLIKKHQANVVPIYIDGQNSKRFYMAGKIHPLLRTLLLGRELLNKKQQCIELFIGEVITFKEIHQLEDHTLINYLRLNTYLLQNTNTLSRNKTQQDRTLPPVVDALPSSFLQQDITRLPDECHLLDHQDFSVYCANAEQIPAILHEIGRIREINFRHVGEGTGLALDLDHFDRDYLHLFIWDHAKQAVVGAYRLGLVDTILPRKGINGLYTSTLFHYDSHFLQPMGKSIEMGRSVIDIAYQKSVAPLLLLWKGIATYVHRNPQYTHLFGPVSISSDYSELTRQLLADTMTLHYYDQAQAELVRASHPLSSTTPMPWNASLLSALADLQLLTRVIARIDEGKGIPVLLRQYLGLNGKLACFNVDPDFNNSLDGLIVVDLRQVPWQTLARYMGKEQAMAYFSQHSVTIPS
ncbi:lysophospholipid acyltransferase family protein [Vibrio cincinnatiensis]|uniref:lysophospholipid acyltransferase family protein n=1 Tax=Vibrio cincinnatiensis TaxID=675 RepID=UPI001EDF28EC|nr:lysophospholipid acyltransferase family protein [Vibrio cincinnatiensis]MCG3734220.1 lysophospholipid acyltransferase family protein [Vibrio cincinnatiensis]MCG3741359.1 lysophospholipid acyltransferase family protein [Vibrio cincinnatiensis]MCG3745046.1 lysophospholipid acyltransferase family protein [Vibrio cincinnatiensis]